MEVFFKEPVYVPEMYAWLIEGTDGKSGLVRGRWFASDGKELPKEVIEWGHNDIREQFQRGRSDGNI